MSSKYKKIKFERKIATEENRKKKEEYLWYHYETNESLKKRGKKRYRKEGKEKEMVL